MRKSGIQNLLDKLSASSAPEAAEALDCYDIENVDDVADQVRDLLSAIAAHDVGAQKQLRDDLTAIYGLASRLRDTPEYFERFAALAVVRRLPRPPKKPEQTLHALLKLASDPKTASARHCRLKSFWKAEAPAQEVYVDLEQVGSSPKGYRVIFDPQNLEEHGINGFPIGAEVGLSLMAIADASNRLVCTVVYAEWSRPI